MTRWALLLEYDGTPFVGWQRQDNGLSVQEVLETAAARLNHGAPVASTVAGRTDAGVHAEAQVAQLDLPDAILAAKVRDALNYHMKPHPVVVLRCRAGAGRLERPLLGDRPRLPLSHPEPRARPALLAGRVWHVHARARRRGDAPRGTEPAGPARLLLVPRRGLPGEQPAAHARPAGCAARRRHRRESSPRRAASCITRCATWWER